MGAIENMSRTVLPKLLIEHAMGIDAMPRFKPGHPLAVSTQRPDQLRSPRGLWFDHRTTPIPTISYRVVVTSAAGMNGITSLLDVRKTGTPRTPREHLLPDLL